jgi:hypothetical protein
MKMREWNTLLAPQKYTLDNLPTPLCYVPSTRCPPDFQPSRGPAYLVFYICGYITLFGY